MGGAAEEPGEGGAFEAPDVPGAVVAEVAFLDEGEAQGVEAAGLLDADAGFLDVVVAEGLEHGLDELLDQLLLLAVHVADADSLVAELVALELDGAGGVGGFLGDEGLGLLLVVEGLEDLVGGLALEPPDVVGVGGVVGAGAGGVVAVEDGATESAALDAIAVGAEGFVAAGADPFEGLVGAGLSEEGDVVLLEALVIDVIWWVKRS